MLTDYAVIESFGREWGLCSSNQLCQAIKKLNKKKQSVLITYFHKLKKFSVDLVEMPDKKKLGFLENIMHEYSTNEDDIQFAMSSRERIYMMINFCQKPLDKINYKRLIQLEFLIEYDGFVEGMNKWSMYHRHISFNALKK